ncbi:HNH endonuclease [Streptomyces sp. NPDC057565]|uniref:HNH endonuclease n=1 Tax=Streptomyces sp. NPDC057565 TaxID=3346169 RepID=UPI003693AFBA
MTKKRAPRIPVNLNESPLIYIGDNHYVEPVTGMVLSRVGHINVYGYEKVEHKGQRAVSVHRLVYEAVHGPIAEGLVINHISGDRADNRPANLEAVTTRENNVHAYASGGRTRLSPHVQGERHPKAKISNAQAQEIKKRAANGEHVPALAEEFGLSVGHTYKIAQQRLGGRAQYGTNNRPKVRTRRKVTPEQEADIQKRAAAGEFVPDLAKEFGLSKSNTYKIARQRRESHAVPD